MAVVDLEHVTRLADALSPSEKQRLIEHLSRQIQPASATRTQGMGPGEKARCVWRSKFGAPADIAVPREPRAGSGSPQPRIAGLNAGEVWMSDDFNAELPDEFWFGEP